ncbi:unnamed protein product [Nesidiocoris tenuis]|uniref:Uncharacterized protein n=1 Tax=Nesidiocoris tenuis TaxID=355587 RepID=A0A6H5H3X6_9HEMI|nr:unnamed protein product [Nesidiocoris tenuis]
MRSPAEARMRSPAEARMRRPAEARMGSPAEARMGCPAEARIRNPTEARMRSPADTRSRGCCRRPGRWTWPLPTSGRGRRDQLSRQALPRWADIDFISWIRFEVIQDRSDV